MDERIWDIAQALEADGHLTADELAGKLALSSKTVRSIVKNCQSEMQQAGFQITAKPGTGFELTVLDQEQFARSRQQASQAVIPRDAEERAEYLMEYLLRQDQYVKMDDLSERFYISKRSLSNTVHEIEQRLGRYGLRIDRKPGHGIRIAGEERQYRICMAARINQGGAGGEEFQQARQKARDIICKLLAQENIRMSMLSLEHFTTHMTVAVCRIRSGHSLQSVGGIPLEIQSHILDAASRLAEELGNAFQVSFSLPEIYYIALHITGKQIYGGIAPAENANLVIPQEIDQLASDMIDRVYEAFRVDFRDNLELRMGLCMHLVPLSARMKSGIWMKNPILQDVMLQYPLAYEMATVACGILEQAYGRSICRDEIGYVAITFALALERQTTELVRKNILIVCGSGKGSAQLLSCLYQKKFGKNLGTVQTCDVLSLGKVDFSKIDYVFSTVPIPVSIPVPIHQIRYFPDKKDISEVKKLLQRSQSTIEPYFSEELFLPHLRCTSREQVLEQMCTFMKGKKDLPDSFLSLVRKREKLAPTTFGNLVAMPHPWKAVSRETSVCIAILDQPVQWGEEQVQVVFLVSIADDKTENLQRFYQVSVRLITDETCIRRLIADRSFHTFLDLIRQKEQELEEEANG